MADFTYRNARSGRLVGGIIAAIVIETVVVHLLLYNHSRIAAWPLTILNLLKPATPNVLLTLRQPIRVRTPGGLHRMAARLGLHLDDSTRFIEAIRH